MTTVRLLFEDGPGVGLGHRRRMESLARALRRQGATTELCRLTGRPALCDESAMVVDAYSVDASRDHRCSSGVVVAIDDLNRDLDVDLVVRPAPSRNPETDVSSGVLEGFRFALIDIDHEARDRRPTADAPVLVSFGATDSDGFGRAVADAIADIGATVVHAPGPWSERSIRADVATIEAPNGLAVHLCGARLVVCAGGVTMLESLAMGRATVVVPTAANQADGVAAVAENGAALVLAAGAPVSDVVESVRSLLTREDLLNELAERGMRLVDGRGPERVAEAILALV